MENRIAEDLGTATRDLWAAVAEPSIDRPERVMRATRAAEAQAALDGLAARIGPYVDGQHSLLADLLVTYDREGARMAGFTDAAGAAERLAQHRAAVTLADLPGLVSKPVVGGPAVPPAALGLLSLAVPPIVEPSTGFGGPAQTETLPAWHGVVGTGAGPQAGGELTELPSVAHNIAAHDVEWRTAGSVINLSKQAQDWTGTSLVVLQQIIQLNVDAALEALLMDDLTVGAGTSPTLDDALAAVAANWPIDDQILLVSPPDRIKALRALRSIDLDRDDRPPVLASPGVDPGAVVVTARSLLRVEANQAEWVAAVEPRILGVETACVRRGRVLVLADPAASVKTVTLP